MAETNPWDSKGDAEKENGVVSCAEALQGRDGGKKGAGASFPIKTTSFTGYSPIKTVYRVLVFSDHLSLFITALYFHSSSSCT